MVLGLADYTFQLNSSGVLLNSGNTVPFVDITKVSGLDNAPYRETVRDHEGVDGGFIDAEFEKGRDIVLEGTVYGDSSSVESFLDSLKSNYAPVTSPIPFYFKSTGVTERVIFVKPRGVRFDWDTARRIGMTEIQLLMYAEDPRIYDNNLISQVIAYGGPATTGFGFTTTYDFMDVPATNGWATADTGETWNNTGGVNGDYSKSSSQGKHSHSAVSTPHFTYLTHAVDSDITIPITFPATATGGAYEVDVISRFTDTSNYYQAVASAQTSGQINVSMGKTVAGVFTSLGSVSSVVAYSPGTTVKLRMVTQGSTLQAKAWLASSVEPADWTILATDSALPSATNIGVRSNLSGANSNTLPFVLPVENFQAWRGFSFNLSFGATVPPFGSYITNSGNRPTPATFVIQGPVTNPRIINTTDSKTLAFFIDLSVSDTLTVDLANKTVLLNGVTNRRSTMTNADWFLFNPGSTFVQFGGLAGSGTLTVNYRNAWR